MSRMVKCEVCGTEREWPRNCPTCGERRMQELKDRQTDQAGALLAHGFSAPFTTGGMFGAEFTSCLTCGAAVALTPLVEGQTHPLDAHRKWHDQRGEEWRP